MHIFKKSLAVILLSLSCISCSTAYQTLGIYVSNHQSAYNLFTGRHREITKKIDKPAEVVITETPISQAIKGSGSPCDTKKNPEKYWHTYMDFNLDANGNPDKLYAHSYLVSLMYSLPKIWEKYNFDKSAKAVTAIKLLKMLQKLQNNINYNPIYSWLGNLDKHCKSLKKSEITKADLPE